MIFVQTACVQCVTEIIDGAAQQLLGSVAQKRSHSAHTEHTRGKMILFYKSATLRIKIMLIYQSLLPLQTTARSFFFYSNDKSAKANTKSKFTIHCFHTVTHYGVHSFSAGKGLHYNHRVVYINIGQALKCVTLKVINYQSAITMTYQDFLTRIIMKLGSMINV